MLQNFASSLKEKLALDFGMDNIQSFVLFLMLMLQRDPRSWKLTTALLENAFLYAHFQI